MESKIRVGILFGGQSREREVSFAGGRTVYDNLNKSLFEPIPVFVDSFGRWIRLDWHFIYKGSIRDFYPPADALPPSPHGFQVYAESLGEEASRKPETLTQSLGEPIQPDDLKDLVDIVFLCLHGNFGEDGRIQGLLEYYGIPYTGSGILPSAIAMDKVSQRRLMLDAGFSSPPFITVTREEGLNGSKRPDILARARKEVGFPLVVKSARQGSSIGVTILREDNPEAFDKALDKSFFVYQLARTTWEETPDKAGFVRRLADFRENIGLPLLCNGKPVYHPEELLTRLTEHFGKGEASVSLESMDAEYHIIIEGFISGKEFSCIVIQDEDGHPIALPPTEIRKGGDLFDYRSKYLPGLSRKITPIDLPTGQINTIRQRCEELFKAFFFDVYARIDGFSNEQGEVFLNDPNTTSGMMPSSFFFHQAAEIGLNPSQFLTYIIRTSFIQRAKTLKNAAAIRSMVTHIDRLLEAEKAAEGGKKKVAVILGGYSSERHISVESGRNIYEKLASSDKYLPIPVFLTGSDAQFQLYEIPVNILLKDNADDIREKAEHFTLHEATQDILSRTSAITRKYTHHTFSAEPQRIRFADLREKADAVFIALHGRPGEDGAVQKRLEELGLPYNGSGPESSSITIDKFQTNALLREHGFLVADHALKYRQDWEKDPEGFFAGIEKQFPYPFIAKPVDDGCSSAVAKIGNREQLEAYARAFFRDDEALPENDARILRISPHTEFTRKPVFLVESLIGKEDADHFLEITGGLLTHQEKDGSIRYEIFEASEALTEGDVLSLAEKFLAGEGQNITPARYAKDPEACRKISAQVKEIFEKVAQLLDIRGYARIDAFVRVWKDLRTEVIIVEVNSLPGMTPATCIFHQCAINGYKPFEFIDGIMEFGFSRTPLKAKTIDG